MDNMLEIRGLTVDYGFIRALKGIDMDIPRGRITVVLGANGAGKSTTLRAVSGIVKSSAGKILLEGRDIRNRQPYAIAKRGVSQSPEGRLILKNLTTEENLRIGGYTLKTKAALEAGFAQVYSLFPILKERRAQQATTLSGGEQQMLTIGRALMMKPNCCCWIGFLGLAADCQEHL